MPLFFNKITYYFLVLVLYIAIGHTAYFFQVQGHAGLRALVLPGTMAESVVPNVLRIMPVLLQCRGNASLSMVSITFTGLARRGYTFKLDVIQAPKCTSISRTPARFLISFSVPIILFFTMNWSRSYFFLFFFCAICFPTVSRSGCSLEFTRTSKMMYRVNCSRNRQ